MSAAKGTSTTPVTKIIATEVAVPMTVTKAGLKAAIMKVVTGAAGAAAGCSTMASFASSSSP